MQTRSATGEDRLKRVGLLSIALSLLLVVPTSAYLLSGEKSIAIQPVEILANLAPVPAINISMTYLDVQADGSASYDPDGTIVSYTWTWGDDTPASYGVTASHHYDFPCTGRQKGYVVTLYVKDNMGSVMSASRTIRPVAPPGVFPSAAFGVSVNGLAVTANATASSDADGYIVEYKWDWGDQTERDYGSVVTHFYYDAGYYVIRLTLRDNSTLCSYIEKEVYVEPVGWAPIAYFTVVVSCLTVTVNASLSYDPDGDSLSYIWDWEDGTESGSGAVATHTYATTHEGRRPGMYLICLVVVDDTGLLGLREVIVPVSDPPKPPVADFEVDMDYLQLTGNAQSSYDPDGTIVAWSWNFGDGTGGTGSTTSHLYPQPGEYLVTLTVTDSQGLKNSTGRLVTASPGLPPNAVFRSWTNGLEVSVDGRSSYDEDGTILSWQWFWGDGTSSAKERDSHRYSAPGVYMVVLRVTDDSGLDDSAFENITVNYVPPVAVLRMCGLYQAVEVFATDSYDPDGTIASYDWSWGDGTVTSGGISAVHSYSSVGQFSITLTVTDSTGVTSSSTLAYSATARPAPTGSFSDSVRVDDSAGMSTQRNAAIAVQGSNMYVVWEDCRDGRGQIRIAKSTNRGATWSPSLLVNGSISSTANQEFPAIAIGPDGAIYVVWQENRAGNGNLNVNVYLARCDNGGLSFAPAVRIDNTGIQFSLQTRLSIAVSCRGIVLAVWKDDREGRDHVYCARSLDRGATFSANFRVDDGVGTNISAGVPSVAVDGVGRFYVAYHDTRDLNSNVFLARSANDGASFSPSVRVDDTGSYQTGQGNPHVSATGDGFVFVIWLDSRNGAYWDIYSSRSLDGGLTFEQNRLVEGYSAQAGYSLPRAAVDPWRNVYAAWRAEGSTGAEIWFSKSTDGGVTFGKSVSISDAPTDSYCGYPSVAADIQGGAHVVWTDDTVDGGDIKHSLGTFSIVYQNRTTSIMSSLSGDVALADAASVKE